MTLPDSRLRVPPVLEALVMGTVGMLACQLLAARVSAAVIEFGRARGVEAAFASPQLSFFEMAVPAVIIVAALAALRGFSLPAMRERYGLVWPAISLSTFALALLGMFALGYEAMALTDVFRGAHWLPSQPGSTILHTRDYWLRNAGLPARLALLLGAGVLPPAAEEFMYRGELQRGLLTRWSPLASILVSSMIFAFFHLDPGRYLSTFAFGCWIGWLAWRCSSIVPGMVLHSINNMFFMALGAFALDAPVTRTLLLFHVRPGWLLVVAVVGFVVFALCANELARRLPAPPTRQAAPVEAVPVTRGPSAAPGGL